MADPKTLAEILSKITEGKLFKNAYVAPGPSLGDRGMALANALGGGIRDVLPNAPGPILARHLGVQPDPEYLKRLFMILRQ